MTIFVSLSILKYVSLYRLVLDLRNCTLLIRLPIRHSVFFFFLILTELKPVAKVKAPATHNCYYDLAYHTTNDVYEKNYALPIG